MGKWQIIAEESTINLCNNPSFETGTTGWATGGTNTIAQSTDQALYGDYSLKYTYSDSTILATFAITLAASTAYALTARVYLTSDWDGGAVTIGPNNFADATINDQTETSTSTAGSWITLKNLFTTGADTSGSIAFVHAGAAAAGNVYIDGVQIEAKAYVTTYCDGAQQDCTWTSTPHASTSTRNALSRAGGRIYDLEDDLGWYVEEMAGIGMPPVNNVAMSRGLLDGANFQRTKVLPRPFRLRSTVTASTLASLHSGRQAILTKIRPDSEDGAEPFLFRYSGAAVEKEIAARYDTGFTFSGQDGFSETSAIQFLAFDPYFQQIGGNSTQMALTSATYTLIAGKIAGSWDNLGPPAAGGTYTDIRALAYDSINNLLYAAGNFLNFDNDADADYIAVYDPSTAAWSPLGSTPLDGIVYALAVDAVGGLYAGGVFANAGGDANADCLAYWNGSTWAHVGPAQPTGATAVYALAIDDTNGNVYVGGDFTTFDGVAGADYIAKYNGATFEALDVGMNGIVYAIGLGPNNDPYIGGAFTDAGAGNGSTGTPVRFAYFDGSAWEPIGYSGAGPNGTVYAIGVTGKPSNPIIYFGGAFTTIDASADYAYICKLVGTTLTGIGGGFDDNVRALHAGSDGTLYVGGEFTTYGVVSGIPAGTGALSCKWNGTGYSSVDIDILTAGATAVYAITSNGTDFYIGFDVSGSVSTSAAASLTNNGTARAYPVISVYQADSQDFSLKSIVNETTGAALYFDLTIQNGETVTIDLRPGRRRMTSTVKTGPFWSVNPSSDITRFYLRPGANDISLYYEGTGPPDVTAFIRWRDAYWSAD